MTDRLLYGTNLLVENFTKELKILNTFDGGWSVLYLDETTGQQWLKYSVDPDRGYFFNLIRTNPNPKTEQLLDTAFTSNNTDEVSAAAYRLYIEEQFENKEYRNLLLNRLRLATETVLDKENTERLKTIIKAAQLLDRVNHRVIVGKHFTEIEKDAKFVNDIADSAQEIMNQLIE